MNLQTKNILIVGDSMLDKYYYGDVLRVSPEAPTVVFSNASCEYRLGGAANVAKHLALANQNVTLISSIGKDEYGDIFLQESLKFGINVEHIVRESKKTTVKARMISKKQQIFRVDDEEFLFLSDIVLSRIIQNFQSVAINSDIVIVSDYNKGFLHDTLLRYIINYCNEHHIKLCIDVKGNDSKKYYGAYLLKPNMHELSVLTSKPITNMDETVTVARELLNFCKCQYILVTCGEHGMILVTNKNDYHFKATACEIYDVTGAGDCVIAYLSACLANDLDIITSVKISNIAAGIQVSRLGTASVLPNEIKLDNTNTTCASKIIPLSSITSIRNVAQSKKIVFTNGCFDIIHVGHIKYLEEASKLGDILVVGLNSDASIKRIKGKSRPYNIQEDRALILAALQFVHYVVIFETDTPLDLIKKLKPDVLVKGGDYTIEKIVGNDIVRSYGGEVVVLSYIEDRSTTLLLNKMENVPKRKSSD